jgi:hypothetical protein
MVQVDTLCTVALAWPDGEAMHTSLGKRRPLARTVEHVLSGVRSQADVTRQHRLKPELLAPSKSIVLEGKDALFQGGEQRDHDEDRIAELERVVGRLTMEREFAKEAFALLASALR